MPYMWYIFFLTNVPSFMNYSNICVNDVRFLYFYNLLEFMNAFDMFVWK